MKNVLKSLALGLGLAVFATAAAYAAPLNGSISLNLTGTYTNGQSATFTSATVGLSSGSFAVFNAGATVGGPNPLVFSQVTPGETLVTITEGANTLTFTSGTDFTGSGPEQALFTDNGFLSLNGGPATAGTFVLTSSGNSGSTQVLFDATESTVAATPEPSSLVLLGSGLVSAAGMLVRRRRIVA